VAPPADARSTVVLLVRHAEKASGGADPALTAEGQKRAESLLRVAAEAGVTAIYATPFQRTRSTARPLSEKLGVPVTTVELGAAGVEAHAQALAQEVLTRQKGQVVLVVGHSNTIPAIAAALTGKQVEPMPETEYDRLLVAVVPAVGEPGLVRARY
jgi:broad specificity phosphatase PhoE